ncbi:hypothetical protein JKF63_07416 [Porcisia hertigi]|uniref:Uncharacterized protein n=1 Tax=Porcisia hertigi TaxID=2761500 RepID=A0A836LKW7_9TRYP|nr:hypothetical protein JKF63_07416 [Porcisia hertigi]
MNHNGAFERVDGTDAAGAAAAAAAAVVVPVNQTLLYHQTLIPTQSVTHAIEGSFTLPDADDIVLIRHDVLELWRLYAEDANGGVECVCRTPLMSAVYAAVAVPTSASLMAKAGGTSSASSPGSNAAGVLDDVSATAHRSGLHYLAVTSETGYVTLLRYQLDEPPVPTRLSYGDDSEDRHGNGGGNSSVSGGATMLVTTSLKGRFIKVSEVCLGRSGTRLTVPGARMAVDPAGTALLITALMRTKTLVPITVSETWDPVKNAHVQGDDDDDDDGGGSESDGSDEEDDEKDGGGHQRRAPVTGRELRAARRRRAASARRANGAINLGTPIEVQRQTVLYSVCALDGYLDHAVFAVLEEEIVEERDSAAASASRPANPAAAAAEAGGGTFLKSSSTSGGPEAVLQHHKHFVLYAYVPSLKQVQRTQLVHVPPTAHRLIAVPAAPYGPGGVLVCTDTELIWYDVSASQQQQSSAAMSNGRVGVFKCTYAFPRRLDCTEMLYDPSIIQHTLTRFGRRFFLLLQDEHGDLYRVFLEAGDVQRAYEALRTRELAQANPEFFLQQQLAANGGAASAPVAVPPVPNPLSVHYFDTLPPSSSMALFRRGFLFVGTEAGPLHGLYKIKSNGYTADREYIVKRVRRERTLPMASSTKTEKTDSVTKKSDDSGDRKRPRAAEAASAAVKPEPPATSSSSAASSMPPPLPRIKKEPTDSNESDAVSAASAATAMGPPAASTAAASSLKTPLEVRVIKVYQPHRRPQHVVQLQSFPNTPAITNFTSHLTSSTSATATAPDGADHTISSSGEQAPSTEPSSGQAEIYFSYVGGRGAESVLVQARYGYAAKLEGRQVLPTVFNCVIPLPSALSMQSLARQQQAAIESAAAAAMKRSSDDKTPRSAGGAARQHAQRLKALRQLAATVSSARDQVNTDRVLLCTRQGTTVYRIGSSVEQDTHSSFITAERTLAATTLQYGCGYVQVTPRGINVLSCTDTAPGSGEGMGTASVLPASWTHPHGNTVLAAAVTPTTVLLSFHQRGGIASFDFGLAGTELQQRDVLPTFPLAPVVALLQPPASAVSTALQRELQALLWNSSAGSPSSAAAAAAASAAAAAAAVQTEQLAAIATVNQEVYLVHPRKLREPLEKINCRRSSSSSSGDTGSSSVADVTITSLLLTYLSDTRGGSDAAAALIGGAGPRRSKGANRAHGSVGAAPGRRQLLLFVGHSDGVVTRYELNQSSAKVTATAELWCGSRPCQLVAGDGETFCYVVSGERTWRCEMQDRSLRMAPYSFPTRPTSFARFVLPSRVSSTAAAANDSDSTTLRTQDNAKEEDENPLALVETITLVPREQQQQEVVIAVHNRELALYVSNTGSGGGGGGGGGGPGSGGVEYSFQHHSLPLAGRRLLQHPTRAAYLILCGVEHRSHGRQEAERHRAEDRAFLTSRMADNPHAEDRGVLYGEGLYGGIPYTAPQRSLGRPNAYHSTLQLYHRDAQRLMPPIYFEPNEAITSVVVGSFFKEFGREPVVIVGTASSYTHGAGCGTAASWRQGFLRTFRCANSGSGGGGGGADALLKLELLHSTYLRPDGPGGAVSGTGKDRRTGANGGVVAAAAGSGGHGSGEAGKPDYPSALCICEPVGLLFVGMGSAQGLRIYSWGKEHLLRRRHLANTPGLRITAIDYVFASPPGSRNLNARNVSFFATDLYQCPYGDAEGMRMAREKQLLIVCGTVNASVFVAALQPGNPAPAAAPGAAGATTAATPSFLLQIITDSVPRHITSVVVVDERTIAASDRFGTVVFLRIPKHTRTQFAQPVHQLQEAELIAEEAYLRTQQTFHEVARHHVGELVTALRVQPHDPSQGTDPALATKIVYYCTALGSLGAYVPLLSEEDGALAAYLQPLLHSHMRPLLGPPTALPPTSYLSHHVLDGDVAQLLRSGSTTPFSAAAKDDVLEALERQVKMEAARRNVLGLPKRTLPSLSELIAKQRALLALPI